MEIDKKIILKLIQALEDLKKSLTGIEIDSKEESLEEGAVAFLPKPLDMENLIDLIGETVSLN